MTAAMLTQLLHACTSLGSDGLCPAALTFKSFSTCCISDYRLRRVPHRGGYHRGAWLRLPAAWGEAGFHTARGCEQAEECTFQLGARQSGLCSLLQLCTGPMGEDEAWDADVVVNYHVNDEVARD